MRWIEIFVRMSVRLIPEYIVIVLVLGAARAWMFPQIGPEIGNQIWMDRCVRHCRHVVRHSNGRRGADHPGDAVARHGRRPRWSFADDAAANQLALAGDGRPLVPAAVLIFVALAIVAFGTVCRSACSRAEVLTNEVYLSDEQQRIGCVARPACLRDQDVKPERREIVRERIDLHIFGLVEHLCVGVARHRRSRL